MTGQACTPAFRSPGLTRSGQTRRLYGACPDEGVAREVDGVINRGETPEGAYRGLTAEKPGHEVHGAGC